MNGFATSVRMIMVSTDENSCQIPKQSIWPTVSYFKTFFALPALAPKCLDSQKFSFNLFCRKEQELFVEYFRFFIAQKMKELH